MYLLHYLLHELTANHLCRSAQDSQTEERLPKTYLTWRSSASRLQSRRTVMYPVPTNAASRFHIAVGCQMYKSMALS